MMFIYNRPPKHHVFAAFVYKKKKYKSVVIFSPDMRHWYVLSNMSSTRAAFQNLPIVQPLNGLDCVTA